MTNLPKLTFAPLRRALLANAVFSTLTGLLLLLDPAPWVRHLAGAPTLVLQVLGASLLAFATWLVWLAARPSMRLAFALGTTLADLGWVVGSGLLIATLPFTPMGSAVVAAVALVVASIGAAQFHGIRRAIAAPDPEHGTQLHYRISADVEGVLPEALWPIIADLGDIAAYYPELESSRLDRDPGPGAIRSCSDRNGAQWREEVIGWEPGLGLDLRFRVDDPEFPMPMAPMVGGWRLARLGSHGTRVTVWWSFTTRPVWAAPLLVPMMDARLHGSMTAVVRAMGAAAASGRGGRSPRRGTSSVPA